MLSDRERRTFLTVLLVIALIVWSLVAITIGRSTMRSDLLKDGYRVRDTSDHDRNTPSAGEGRWLIEIWRDGWVSIGR